MKDNYQVIKLTSGENIICDLKESDNNYLLQVKSPLKMEIVNRVTKSGMVEALALTRWVQPFTEQETISKRVEYIAKKGKPVLIATGASTLDEVKLAMGVLQKHTKNIVLMQCNTNYTASIDNFKYISKW